MRLILSLALCASLSVGLAFADKNSNRSNALSPAEQQKTFKLSDGFVIELVASEEHGLINPIDLTFDDAGRLWTHTAQMYPLDPVTGINFGKALQMMKDPNLEKKFPRVAEIQSLYQLKTRGEDKILIVDDPTKEATKPLHVWADGLAIPQSIMPYKNGCYVAHGSEFLYLKDENNDGKQDAFETAMTGFGFFDTHTMSHSIVRAPGGWLNFSQGALNSGNVKLPKSGKELNVTYAKNLRYSLDGEDLEVVGIARDNVWGYQLRANGQWYATSANDNGVSVLPVEDHTAISGIGGDKEREYQPLIDSVHEFRVGGSGISGLAFSEDGEYGFPEEWEDVAFLANPITRTINCVKIKRLPSGEIVAERLPDLLSCEDEWFRPVNLEIGPDGCLYIADWYNRIVSHNEVSTDHPDRDRSHGRIWRVRHESQKPLAIPNVAKAENSALVGHLVNGKTLWEKRAAWHQIVDREAKELSAELSGILTKNGDYPKEVVIHALWSLEGLGTENYELVKGLLASKDGDIRREAVRSLASFNFPVEVIASLLTPYVNDEDAMVRSQVLRTLAEVGVANQETIALLVTGCRPVTGSKEFGAGYEEYFERFLARKALEEYPEELVAFFKSPASKEFPGANIIWASQALPVDLRLEFFVENWKKSSAGEIEDSTFISMAEMLNRPEMVAVAEPVFQSRTEEMIQKTLATKESINLPLVTGFFKEYIEGLLNNTETMSKGLSLIKDLSTPHHTGTLLKLLAENPDLKTSILSALGTNPNKVPNTVYLDIFNQEEQSFSVKLDMLAALYAKDNKAGTPILKAWIPELDEGQLKTVVQRLSYNNAAVAFLLGEVKRGTVPITAWTANTTPIARSVAKRDPNVRKIQQVIDKEKAVKAQERTEKIKAYTASYDKLEGNPTMGQALFQACLACHQVGSNGVAVGPPLDGSANRDIGHLITAIVDPNAAVESAYGAYYVAKKDGKVIEAMLKRETDKGTTLIASGGIETFIPQHLILSKGRVEGKSFMPESFGNFPEQTMADLISYIQTLE